jgi:mono/diheme cytochrome c family protein
MKGLVIGLLVGILILPIAAAIYLFRVHIPVAVADKPLTWEEKVIQLPLRMRLAKERSKTAPIEANAYNLQAGMQIYRSQCASCHGMYEHPSSFGSHMYPVAPQLWTLHPNGVVGVSDDPIGETYWKISNGIQLTGMPSFKGVLSDNQLWQVSLLMANANKPLPVGVLDLLRKPLMNVEPLPVGEAASSDMPDVTQLPQIPPPPTK